MPTAVVDSRVAQKKRIGSPTPGLEMLRAGTGGAGSVRRLGDVIRDLGEFRSDVLRRLAQVLA
jgi:hypothetical protein